MGNLTTAKSGELVSFASPNAAAIKSLKVHFSPKQAGSGDPSPENIRPFVPWTEFEVTHCGKNLCDNPIGGGDYMNLPIPPGMTATASSRIGGNFTLANDFDDNFQRYTQVKDDDLNRYKITFTVQENENTYRFNRQSGSQKCQLEVGSTATPYEPYRGQTIQTEFDRTIYGGWADLVTGEVVRDWLINTHTVAATDGTPGGTGTGNDTNYRFIAWNLASAHLPDNERTKQAVCNIAPNSTQVGGTRFWLGRGTVYMVLPNDNKEYSVIIAYAERDLNTDTYQLEPTELQTLIGTNNIWSNADYVEVEYEIAEPKSILDIKKRIIAAAPHIITPSPTSIQTFNTDMVSPLKECKVHFSPVQEGTGDPSPENVRPITGWTGVEVTRCGKNLIGLSDFVESGKYISKQGVISSTSQFGYTKPFHLKSGRYILTGTNQYYSNATIRIHSYNPSGVWQRQIAEQSKDNGSNYEIYFDVLETDAYIRISAPAFTSTYPNLQLEYSSLPTSYEPYSGTTIHIDCSDSGTIYGGYIDLVNGEVWKTHEKITVDGVNFVIGSGFGIYNDFATAYNNITGQEPSVGKTEAYILSNFTSDHFKVVFDTWSNPTQEGLLFPRAGGNNAVRVFVSTSRLEDISTTAAAKASLQKFIKANPFNIIYPLATPLIIGTIDHITLKTLRGLNNVWSNANGNIELSYWKH